VVRAQRKSQEEANKSGDVEMKEAQVKEDESKEKDKDNKDKGEKIVKTDKVLIGNKTSWAVAKAMGEVSGVSSSACP
jgi:Xaa-Pro aminopeptidase